MSGYGVSGGIAIGPAHVVESGFAQIPEYTVAPEAVEAERNRLADAIGKARRQIRKLKARALALPGPAAEEVSDLLDAHLAIVSASRLIRGVEKRITEQRNNAEFAIHAEIVSLAAHFAAMEDRYLAGRIQDIRDVGHRLIRALIDRKYQAFSTLPLNSIILAEEMTPADTALMDPQRVAGFGTTFGGVEGHAAIMARSLGLPAVVGVGDLMRRVRPGQLVIIDGERGRVIVEPGSETLDVYRERQAQLADRKQALRGLINLPARTRDGIDIGLLANVELPREVSSARGVGARGIGLLRTEFLFMNREDLPGEDEQYETLRDIVVGMAGLPVTLRTLDVGGEKLTTALGSRFAESANPALGLRAIRLGLREPPLLERQLAAMLRAGAHGPIRILVPMIASISEVRQVRAILARVVRRLKRRKAKLANPLPPLGIMIEVPGAALAADALAQTADFFAIGTNDLIQYTLAIDRGDEQVADLYDPLHPAVLRLIQFATEAALRARIPVSVCGELAGDPRFTEFLIGLGIRELSMSPAMLLEVKHRLRTLSSISAARRADLVMSESDPGRIAELLAGVE